jgi:DNA-binding transcriptional ArsR family regulator
VPVKGQELKAKIAQGKVGAKRKADLEPVDQRLMKGLSHPLRVQILTLINERPWSPRELQKELNEGLSQVSYHVKVLKDFELIELVKTEPRRGAVEHFYSPVQRIIIPEGMSAGLPKSARLEMLAKIIRDAERDVRESLKAGAFYEREDFHASWTPMDLDEQGCADLHARADEFLADLLKIESESANRQTGDTAESIPISVAVFAFGSTRDPGKKKSAHRRRG